MTFMSHLVLKLTAAQHLPSALKATTLQGSYLKGANQLFAVIQEKKVASQTTYRLFFTVAVDWEIAKHYNSKCVCKLMKWKGKNF